MLVAAAIDSWCYDISNTLLSSFFIIMQKALSMFVACWGAVHWFFVVVAGGVRLLRGGPPACWLLALHHNNTSISIHNFFILFGLFTSESKQQLTMYIYIQKQYISIPFNVDSIILISIHWTNLRNTGITVSQSNVNQLPALKLVQINKMLKTCKYINTLQINTSILYNKYINTLQ